MSTDYRTRLYEQYVTTHTGAYDVQPEPEYALRRQIIPLLPGDRSSRILDVGCGAGELVGLLRQLSYNSAVGIDVSKEQVALAAARGVAGVEHADIVNFLQESAGTFDVVIALDFLEHFDNQAVIEVLDLVAGALRPGGHFVARTPNAVSPFAGRYRYGDFTHGTSFTSRSLAQLLQATGFRDFQFYPVNPLAHTVSSSVRRLVWFAIAGLMKFALAVETGDLRGHIVTQNLVVHGRR